MSRKAANITKKINLASRMPFAHLPTQPVGGDDDSDLKVMADPRYLRQSASLIAEALQKGFDVLQMANGDIVTTGTKTVVYTYGWDEEKGKLVRSKARLKKDDSRVEADVEEDSDEFEEL